MKKILKLTLLITIGTINYGWGQKILDVTPSKIDCEEFKDPKGTIKKVYTQQIGEHSPNTIEVTEELMTWNKEQVSSGDFWTGDNGNTTVSLANTVYFESIIDLKVITKRGRYEIRFTNKANGKEYIVFLMDKDLAMEGYHAIDCMMKKH